jgi:hypothetical protein
MAFVNHPVEELEKSLRDYASPRCEDIRVQESDSKLKATKYETKSRIIEMATTNPFEGEGPIRRTREGGSEWEPIKILLEGDGNSYKMNTASNTRLRLTTQVGQAHVATGVPLDLGTNTQPSDPRTQRNTKPRVYRPTPVRPVSTTGQTGPCW